MASLDIRIRAQESDDLPAINDLWNLPRVVWGTLQMPMMSVEARRTLEAASPPGLTRLVAIAEDRLVGSIVLERFTNRRAHVGTIGMAVHDAYSGLGVGSAMLEAVIGLADRWLGLKRLELSVWADNTRAIALYERFGFEHEGVRRAEGFRDGAYVDAIAMARVRGI